MSARDFLEWARIKASSARSTENVAFNFLRSAVSSIVSFTKPRLNKTFVLSNSRNTNSNSSFERDKSAFATVIENSLSSTAAFKSPARAWADLSAS